MNLSDENGQRDEAAVLGVDEGAPQQTDLTRDTHSLDQHLPESGVLSQYRLAIIIACRHSHVFCSLHFLSKVSCILLIRAAAISIFMQSTQITASLLDNDQCSPQVYADRAKEYKIWAQITIVASVIFCFFPFSFICLVLAYFSGEEVMC